MLHKFGLVVLSILAIVFTSLLISQLAIHTIDGYEENSISLKIQKQIVKQNHLDSQIINGFLNYETVVDKYITNQTDANKKALLSISQQLSHTLNKASHLYGLSVKRPIDLFQVWKFQFEKKLLKSPKAQKKRPWTLSLLSYQELIRKKINSAQQDYQNLAFNQLLFLSNNHINKPKSETVKKVKLLYQNKVKALMPAAIQWFKSQNDFTNCIPNLLDISSPESVARYTTFIQYRSRYCAFMAKSKANSFYQTLRLAPTTDDNKKRINDALAVYRIAQQRMQQEIKSAQAKYGHLSYVDYFKKYVRPLIPKYRKVLRAKSQSENQRIVFSVCEPGIQPVVDFRNPKIDAKVAAYEMYGYQYCHSYFQGSDKTYQQLQVGRYKDKRRSK
ncbi:MAG: hypothetical protein K0U12_01830 [Gammaproteobacteria bacterium]|nr:hypothetical protein [Gammaproteobacteria bacterium]